MLFRLLILLSRQERLFFWECLDWSLIGNLFLDQKSCENGIWTVSSLLFISRTFVSIRLELRIVLLLIVLSLSTSWTWHFTEHWREMRKRCCSKDCRVSIPSTLCWSWSTKKMFPCHPVPTLNRLNTPLLSMSDVFTVFLQVEHVCSKTRPAYHLSALRCSKYSSPCWEAFSDVNITKFLSGGDWLSDDWPSLSIRILLQ